MKLVFELPPESTHSAYRPLLRPVNDRSRHQDAILRHRASHSITGTGRSLRGNPGSNREDSRVILIRCCKQSIVVHFEASSGTFGTYIGHPIGFGVPVD